MSKFRKKRGSPGVDMTAMVDVAFLLLTFFILASEFRPPREAVVDSVTSYSEKEPPKENLTIVTIEEKGRIFLKIIDSDLKEEILRRMVNRYRENRDLKGAYPESQLVLNDQMIEEFQRMDEFGMPLGTLCQYLAADEIQREKILQTGIPCNPESPNNELKEWLRSAKLVAAMDQRRMEFAIDADRETPQPVYQKILQTQLDAKITRTYFVTRLSDAPAGYTKPPSLLPEAAPSAE